MIAPPPFLGATAFTHTPLEAGRRLEENLIVAAPRSPNSLFERQRRVTEWRTTGRFAPYSETAIRVEPSAIVALATTGIIPRRAGRRTPPPLLQSGSAMSGLTANPLAGGRLA